MSSTRIDQTLSFSWDYVASLFWNRYPNPFSKHVITEDVLERRVLPNGNLYTKRLIMKQGLGNFPLWLRKFLSGARELVVEESILDTRTRHLNTVTQNVGALTKYATVIEYCSYEPALSNFSHTSIRRALCVESGLKSAILSPLIYYISRRYRSTAKASYFGYEYICNLNKNKEQTLNTFNSRTTVSETIKNMARNRTKEAREFASNKLPHVIMADSGSLKQN